MKDIKYKFKKVLKSHYVISVKQRGTEDAMSLLVRLLALLDAFALKVNVHIQTIGGKPRMLASMHFLGYCNVFKRCRVTAQ